VSVEFCRDTLGVEPREGSYFSSLRTREAESAILNLEKGHPGKRWGGLILQVTDVDAFWAHLRI
jgi:hypothetical protein